MNTEINNMGRMVSLEAGLPISVPGITLDRQCAASLNAIAYGAIQIMAGFADTIGLYAIDALSGKLTLLDSAPCGEYSAWVSVVEYA